MGLNLKKEINVIIFVFALPLLSSLISKGFYYLFPDLPPWLQFISPVYIYILLFLAFDRYFWYLPIFRLVGIVTVPDLRGRWEGRLRSSFLVKGKPTEIKVVFEIKQRFTGINVKSFFEKSDSISLGSDFVTCVDSTYLYYVYENEPNSLSVGNMRSHKGTVKLRSINKNNLQGLYYNNIGNTGEINLARRSKELKNQY